MKNFAICWILSIVLLPSCEVKNHEFPKLSQRIEISIDSISGISYRGAILYGKVGSTYGWEVSDCGFCWDTVPFPNLRNNVSSFGHFTTGINGYKFTTKLDNLIPGQHYSVRAYLIINNEIKYTNNNYFVTIKTDKPSLDSLYLKALTTNSVLCGAKIYNEGGLSITSRGICWDTLPEPNIDDNSIKLGDGDGQFETKLSNLRRGTRYYVRAFAINDKGLAYSDELSFTTFYGELTDYDGNHYYTVKIGAKIWMAENLKVTHYADGTQIPLINRSSDWEILGYNDKALCWYQDDPENKDFYGGYYTWPAAMNGSGISNLSPSYVQGVCPDGWHLPSKHEANISGSYDYLKEGYWSNPYEREMNVTGFSALPAGSRSNDGFDVISSSAVFWTTSGEGLQGFDDFANPQNAYVVRLRPGIINWFGWFDRNMGCSVRCVKDY